MANQEKICGHFIRKAGKNDRCFYRINTSDRDTTPSGAHKIQAPLRLMVIDLSTNRSSPAALTVPILNCGVNGVGPCDKFHHPG